VICFLLSNTLTLTLLFSTQPPLATKPTTAVNQPTPPRTPHLQRTPQGNRIDAMTLMSHASLVMNVVGPDHSFSVEWCLGVNGFTGGLVRWGGGVWKLERSRLWGGP